nr:hypothetical protein [Marinicella sp. W31]MDC2878131.1 hypothetical protein [Marinicella sp. W31]
MNKAAFLARGTAVLVALAASGGAMAQEPSSQYGCTGLETADPAALEGPDGFSSP